MCPQPGGQKYRHVSILWRTEIQTRVHVLEDRNTDRGPCPGGQKYRHLSISRRTKHRRTLDKTNVTIPPAILPGIFQPQIHREHPLGKAGMTGRVKGRTSQPEEPSLLSSPPTQPCSGGRKVNTERRRRRRNVDSVISKGITA